MKVQKKVYLVTEVTELVEQAEIPRQPVKTKEPIRYTHLPNPPIPVSEYNAVSEYCKQFDNMTRMDFVELAIIEKLHRDGLLPDEEFKPYYDEIRNRPPQWKRKGAQNKF